MPLELISNLLAITLTVPLTLPLPLTQEPRQEGLHSQLFFNQMVKLLLQGTTQVSFNLLAILTRSPLPRSLQAMAAWEWCKHFIHIHKNREGYSKKCPFFICSLPKKNILHALRKKNLIFIVTNGRNQTIGVIKGGVPLMR